MEEEPEKRKSSLEFLLKEYEIIRQLWMHENNQAEHRVTFFLTILFAAVGVIIYLMTSKNYSIDVLAFLVLGSDLRNPLQINN